MLKKSPIKSKTQAMVDKMLTEKYKDKVLFPEKLKWAKEHVQGRDINKEIEEALKKEKTQISSQG